MSSTDIQRFHVGARLSEMAVFNGVVYLAGMVPEDGATDIRGQTADVLAQIDRLLAEAGSDKTRILRTQIYLADMADFQAMNEVYSRHLGESLPARTTIAAAGLPRGARVEIDVVAVGRDL